MNPAATAKARQAFTLIELLVVIAIVFILFMMIAPMRNTGDRLPAETGQCSSNQRQISIGYMLYAEDHRDAFPWQSADANSNTRTLNLEITAVGCFAALTNYLRQPGVYICPADKQRTGALTNFSNFSNSNLSYFVALDASIIQGSTNISNLLLSGDRHLAWKNNQAMPGLLSVTNFTVMSWTKEFHLAKNQKTTMGVLAFADGHTETVRSEKLWGVFQRQGIATSQLVIP